MEGDNTQISAMTNEGGPEPTGDTTTERNWEVEARAEGWRPKEEFRGPEERWIDAKEFVERGEKFAPIIKAKNRKLEQQIEELKASTAQFIHLTNQQLAREREQKESLLTQIQDARAKAIEEGNGKAVINFERQEAQVRDQIGRLQPPAPVDPVVVAWRQANPWYGSDEDASDFADAAGYKFRQTHPEATPQQVLAHIEGRVKARFTEYSDTPRQQRVKPAGPEGGTATAVVSKTGAPKKMTLADLPDDVSRDVARRIIRSMGTKTDKDGNKIPVMTEESYMKSYMNQGQ